MEFPHDLTDEIKICIESYIKVHHKLPKYAILSDECSFELGDLSNPMVIPDGEYPDKKYLLHEKGRGRIKILTQKDLPEKELSGLTEKTKEMGLALGLSNSKRIKKAMFYDISLQHETLAKKLETPAQ